MKNFDKIKRGTPIYWEMKPGHVTKREKDKKGKTKICLFAQGIGGYTNTAVTSPADIFHLSDHMVAVSKIVVDAQQAFYEGFHGHANKQIFEMFVKHWKGLCRAENNEVLFETRKKRFEDFVTEITKAKEIVKGIKVAGIPFIKEE